LNAHFFRPVPQNRRSFVPQTQDQISANARSDGLISTTRKTKEPGVVYRSSTGRLDPCRRQCRRLGRKSFHWPG